MSTFIELLPIFCREMSSVCPILRFTSNIFRQIREVCKMLKDGTHERFPGLENSAVGSFIFLRYICPAIVSPEGFGIVNGNNI